MFGNSKIYRIFAPYLTSGTVKNAAIVAICLFSIVYDQQQVYCCTLLVVAAKLLLTVPKVRVQQFFLFNSFFTKQLERSVKNAIGAKYSTLVSTSDGTKSEPTIELNITCSKNPYIFAVRKAFREFLDEETRGYLYCNERLIQKLDAASLIYPEYVEILKLYTIKTR